MKKSEQESLRAQARRLFPQWTRRKQAEWVIARRRVNSGTWAFPVGEKHVPTSQIAEFLRKLPPGPNLELVETAFHKRRKLQRAMWGK